MTINKTFSKMSTEGGYKRMGLHLKAVRLARSMTQGDLAALVGVTTQAISNLENGYRVWSVDLWDRLEDALGVNQRMLRQPGLGPVKALRPRRGMPRNV